MHEWMTVLCPGCPLRGFLYTMEQCKQVPVFGELGCFIHQKENLLQDLSSSGRFCLVSADAFLQTGLKSVEADRNHMIPVIWDNDERKTTGLVEEALDKMGISTVLVVDPWDLTAMRNAAEEALQSEMPAAILLRRPCCRHADRAQGLCEVDRFRCLGCKKCLRVACPALGMKNRTSWIDPSLCVGCTLCAQICPVDAILRKKFVTE